MHERINSRITPENLRIYYHLGLVWCYLILSEKEDALKKLRFLKTMIFLQ